MTGELKAAIKKTIFLVDDVPVFRKGLRLLLEEEQDIRVVGEAGADREAIHLSQQLSPDLIVLNISVPDLDGAEAIRQILSKSPDTKVMVLSIHAEKEFVKDMLRAGATGYVLKRSDPKEIIQGIRKVLAGDVYVTKEITRFVVSESKHLFLDTDDMIEFPSDLMLKTKIHRPAVGLDILPRAQLMELIDRGRSLPFTLISAGAGYGKSTLASMWLEKCDWLSAWISLDEKDNNMRLFITNVVKALEDIIPAGLPRTRSLLLAQTMPVPTLLARILLNDLDTIHEDFILALDDYHLISEIAIHDLISELLKHPPQSMHLVLITRRDPPLPVMKLRANGKVNEIAMAQLRFSREETKAFFQKTLELTLDDTLVTVLDEKLEGWAAGLRLAALSLKNQKDLNGFLRISKQDFRFITDYLVEEIVSRQPPAMVQYLMETAILDRFCPELCEAIHYSKGEHAEDGLTGQEFIEWLEKRKLFVVALDEHHWWFRYHHLFKSSLLKQLKLKNSSEGIATLHSRAAGWFESHGLVSEAIEHTVAARDFVRAAEIVEKNWNDEFNADRWYVVDHWLDLFPEDIKRERPILLLTEAWITVLKHQLAQASMLVDQAESLIQNKTIEPILSAEISFLRGYIAYFDGKSERSLQYIENALAELSGKKLFFLGEAELMLGIVRCMAGHKDLAVQTLKARIGEVELSEPYLLSRLLAGLAFVHLICGELYPVQVDARDLLRLSKKHNMALAQSWSYYFLACSYLHTGKFEAASFHFELAIDENYSLEPRAMLDALAGLVMTQQFMRLDEEAGKSCRRLQELAEELNERNYFSLAQSCQARLFLLRGDLNSAVECIRSVEESPDVGELFVWVEAPLITKARVLIATGSKESLLNATKLLQSIRNVCEEHRLTYQIIEVSVLQSMALELRGHTEKALSELEEVMVLASPRGWIRPFIEAGPPMAALLKQLITKDVSINYIEGLLKALGDDKPVAALPKDPHSSLEPSLSTSSHWQSAEPLVEPLTNREIQILELLEKRFQNKEIADELFISLETVKTHLKNIYQKLNVGNRRKAVARAFELGILHHP